MFRVENVLFMSCRRIQNLPIKTMTNHLLSTSKHMLTVNVEQVGISIIQSESFVHATRTTPFGFRRLKQTNTIQNNLTI